MSALESIATVRGDKAMIGIPLLDEKMGGGFRRDSTLLFFSEIPAERRIFAEHFVMTGVKNNETCLYIDFFRAPQLVRREMQKFGQHDEGKLILVDATSSQLLLPTTEKYVIKDVSNLEEILEVVTRTMEEIRPQRVVLDSVEFLVEKFSPDQILGFLKTLDEKSGEIQATLCYLFIRWAQATPQMRELQDMADFIVEFKSSISGGVMRSLMRIQEMRKGGFKTNWVPYTFKDLVGVTVYFPRILVTGPFNAGKSTVVRSLCNTSVSVDKMGTTVAFDYGNVDMMGIEADVFGTPGQERFEFIFKIFAKEVSGILLVVDASRPDDFERAKRMLELVGPGLPFVVLANKSDLKGALSADDVRKQLGMEGETPVLSSVATTGIGIKDAMMSLAGLIIGVR